VKVNLTKQHIKIELIESNQFKILIDSDLPWAIRAEESTWSLVPGEYIHVTEFSYFSILKSFLFRFHLKNLWNVGGRIF
jgi:hypothetical protein